jgi:hypothetical protein
MEPPLIKAFQEHGYIRMAENYAFCGNPNPAEAGRDWDRRQGLSFRTSEKMKPIHRGSMWGHWPKQNTIEAKSFFFPLTPPEQNPSSRLTIFNKTFQFRVMALRSPCGKTKAKSPW